MDDGLRSGLLTMEQLARVSHLRAPHEAVLKAHTRLAGRRLVHETVRRMIDTLVTDLIRTSERNIASRAPASIEEVRRAPPLIAFSAPDARARAWS